MKSVCLLLAMSLLSAWSQTARSADPVVLRISAPATVLHLGAPVPIQVEVENISNADIIIERANSPDGSAELTFTVDVLDGFGARAPYTNYGRALVGKHPTEGIFKSTQTHTLKPHEKLIDTLNLEKVYDLNRPGKYTIQVKKSFGKRAAQQCVTSNALTITIN